MRHYSARVYYGYWWHRFCMGCFAVAPLQGVVDVQITLRSMAKSLHVHGFIVLEYAGESLGGFFLVGVVFT